MSPTDPLRPDLTAVTPVDIVARLGRVQRRTRVKALTEQAHTILADALTAHQGDRRIVGYCLLWSGGTDSNTLAHLFRDVASHAIHANTGIGIEQTRQHVRDTCRAWGLPLIEHGGDSFEAFVAEHGFPGPAQHYRMYQRLKERALRKARRELVHNGMRERVVFLAGRRRQESARRGGLGSNAPVPLHERIDSVIWVSPLAMWTKLDINTYAQMHDDVPRNEVCTALHMSGECLCGCFAKAGELDMIRFFYPDAAAKIDRLAALARRKGVPAERCVWGWGAYRTSRRPRQAGPLCTSCSPAEQIAS